MRVLSRGSIFSQRARAEAQSSVVSCGHEELRVRGRQGNRVLEPFDAKVGESFGEVETALGEEGAHRSVGFEGRGGELMASKHVARVCRVGLERFGADASALPGTRDDDAPLGRAVVDSPETRRANELAGCSVHDVQRARGLSMLGSMPFAARGDLRRGHPVQRRDVRQHRVGIVEHRVHGGVASGRGPVELEARRLGQERPRARGRVANRSFLLVVVPLARREHVAAVDVPQPPLAILRRQRLVAHRRRHLLHREEVIQRRCPRPFPPSALRQRLGQAVLLDLLRAVRDETQHTDCCDALSDASHDEAAHVSHHPDSRA
mmetsp:Transcript_7412/g.22578  ORF Transcript_7412/g.22578 Transcript_7412/m.22578 type:complete len:320 (+) Transcript_7412:1909-2868(+)